MTWLCLQHSNVYLLLIIIYVCNMHIENATFMLGYSTDGVTVHQLQRLC